jgi:hypothetical protein
MNKVTELADKAKELNQPELRELIQLLENLHNTRNIAMSWGHQ